MNRYAIATYAEHRCCWSHVVVDTTSKRDFLGHHKIVCECDAEDAQRIADALNATEPKP